MEGKLLSRQEAGEVLGVSAQTVSRLVRDGSLTAHRVGAKRVMVSEESLRQYIAEREMPKAGSINLKENEK